VKVTWIEVLSEIAVLIVGYVGLAYVNAAAVIEVAVTVDRFPVIVKEREVKL